MANNTLIPEKINAYNVYYKGSNRLVGLSDEVKLPDLEALSEEMSGPGILGNIDMPTIGHFGSMEVEIPFRSINQDMFALIEQESAVDFTLRGSEQYTDANSGITSFKGVRIIFRGKTKKITSGSFKQAAGTASSVTFEVQYMMVEVDGVQQLELDKLNFVYKVQGKDLLKEVRNQV